MLRLLVESYWLRVESLKSSQQPKFNDSNPFQPLAFSLQPSFYRLQL